MQIGSGQSALSLALLKALGTQPGTPGAAAQDPAVTRAAESKIAAAKAPAIPPADASGCDSNLPRGSFVDLRA